MKIIALGLFAILAIAGFAFAFGGFGNMPNMQNISTSVQADFMKAVHTGDYTAAKKLYDQYGIGGRMMADSTQEMFNLRKQMQDAMDSGDYTKAVELREELQELLPQKGMHKGGLEGMGGNGPMQGRMKGNCSCTSR